MKLPLLLAFALVGTLGAASWAQTDPPTQLAPAQEKERTYQIPLRNVKASLIAWWLDPENHQAPALSGLPPRPSFDATKDKMGLPAGVSRIVAVDPQNALLVFGTSEGAERLASIIRILDRPLRQVEIEAQFYRVASEEVEKLGLRSTPSPGQSPLLRGNFDSTFAALVVKKKAMVLTAPRLTLSNMATGNLKYEVGLPAMLDVTRARSRNESRLFVNPEGFEKATQGANLQVINNHSWKVTPTINNDDTVTLSVEGEQKLELQGKAETDGAVLLERQLSPQFVANLRDGETIAVEEKTFPASTRPSTTRTVVLLTARIIRRVGDDDAVGSVDVPVGVRQ